MKTLSSVTIIFIMVAVACMSKSASNIQYEEVQIIDVKAKFSVSLKFEVGETPTSDTTYSGAILTLLPANEEELEVYCSNSIIKNKDELDALWQLGAISRVKIDTAADPWSITKIYN